LEFRLYYRGPLKANGGPSEKHALRKSFHPQLKELFAQKPLNAYGHYLDPSYINTNILVTSGAFRFAPLINSRLHTIAKLDIIFLRPEEPGAIISRGGDIDNRLKTLFDALKMPHEPNALPAGVTPNVDEQPFFCLLEDDNLITEVTVRTDRLLDAVTVRSEVVLLIQVKTSVTIAGPINIPFQ
jgi:hypothetical protein